MAGKNRNSDIAVEQISDIKPLLKRKDYSDILLCTSQTIKFLDTSALEQFWVWKKKRFLKKLFPLINFQLNANHRSRRVKFKTRTSAHYLKPSQSEAQGGKFNTGSPSDLFSDRDITGIWSSHSEREWGIVNWKVASFGGTRTYNVCLEFVTNVSWVFVKLLNLNENVNL